MVCGHGCRNQKRRATCRRLVPTRLEYIRLLRRLLDSSDALLVFAGGLNFAAAEQDRINLQNGELTGGRDATEQRFGAQLLPQERLCELYQTYAGAAVTSRIDRLYTNQHLAEQLDRHIFVAPLEFSRLSQHRPLAFGRVCRLPGATLAQPRGGDPSRRPLADDSGP